MENLSNKLTAVAPQEGRSVSVAGGTYRMVITGKQTGGAYAVIHMTVPPQGGPGPHSHANFQEAFYVLEGEIEVKTEFQTFTAQKGSFVNIPLGGLIHCFKNLKNTTAHLLCTVVPSGLEEFFMEIGKPAEEGSSPMPPAMNPEEQQRLKSIAEKYGQKLYPPDYLD